MWFEYIKIYTESGFGKQALNKLQDEMAASTTSELLLKWEWFSSNTLTQ